MNILWHVMGNKPMLVANNVASDLFKWVIDEQQYISTEEEWNKMERILNVAKRMEQRYRAWHGLDRLAGM